MLSTLLNMAFHLGAIYLLAYLFSWQPEEMVGWWALGVAVSAGTKE